MIWKVVAATILPLVGAHNFTVPMPRLYQDRNVIVTLRPALDADLDYLGMSLMIRTTPSHKAP